MEQISKINNICPCSKTVPTILEGTSLYESMCRLVTHTNSLIDEVNTLITAYNTVILEFDKYLPLSGGTMTGALDMNNNSISNIASFTTKFGYIQSKLPSNAWQGDTTRATNVKYVNDNGINQIDGTHTSFTENYNFFTSIDPTFDAFLNEHFGLCFIANNLLLEINGMSTKDVTCFWWPRYSDPETNVAGWTTLVYDTDKHDYYNINFDYKPDNETATITVTPIHGGTMTESIDMNNNDISNIKTLTTNTAYIKTNLPSDAWSGDTTLATNVKYVNDNGINQIDGMNTYFIENSNFFTSMHATFVSFLNEHFGLCFIANNLQFEINGTSTRGLTCFWCPRYSDPETNSAGWTTLVYDTVEHDYYNINFDYRPDDETANITVTPVISTLPELNYIPDNNGTFTGTLTNGDMTLSESGLEVSNTSDGTISTGFVEGTSNDTVTGMRSTKNLFLYGEGITLNANNGNILVQGTLQNANCTTPTSPNQITNKSYVDNAISSIPTPSGIETFDGTASGWVDSMNFINSISAELDEFLIMNYNKPFILTENYIEMNGHSSDSYLNMWTPITPPDSITHSWQTITKDAQNKNTYLLKFNYIHSESATLEVDQLNLNP